MGKGRDPTLCATPKNVAVKRGHRLVGSKLGHFLKVIKQAVQETSSLVPGPPNGSWRR